MNLEAVRQALRDVLAREVPELKTIYPVEPRTSTVDELPTAWFWRGSAAPDQVQEFGRERWDFNWNIRILHQLDEDAESQYLNDLLTTRLITAFVGDNAFLDGSGIVDQVIVSSIAEPEFSTVQQVPVLVLQAVLTSTVTTA